MEKNPNGQRHAERGAALISVLLVSMLLLSAGGVLLLTTSMSATSPLEATAEMQAYYAAEAGLQRTLNLIRSKDLPAGAIPQGQTELTFRDVVKNKTLAGWLPADGPKIDNVQTTLVGTNAFSVVVADPGDPGPLKQIDINPTYVPKRLVVQVKGYGPRRAKKVLSMILIRGGLAGFTAPATITIVGSDSLLPPEPLTFSTGNSGAVRYTGNDASGGSGVSAFAVVIPDVLPTIAGIEKPGQVIGPAISVLGPSSPISGIPPTPKPAWLESAEEARKFVYGENGLYDRAHKEQRYFTTKPSIANMSNPKQLTFIDGDVDLGAGDQGSGLLVVTGKLTTHGNTNFKGVILVLGEGSVERSGGGNGTISGGIIVARFDKDSGGFQRPTFTTDGGGSSLLQYDSKAVSEAMSALPGFDVAGVVEKGDD
ncbi:MAG TPA: hypothetical protein VN256_09365 [Pyrinomonadaceae bacterium]|nr:hypothetical protein [Pyrinomonadaceae bacterium]